MKAKATAVSYNFKTNETMTKEFFVTPESNNPISDAEDFISNNLRHQYCEEDGWQHKIFANKKADMLRKKAWANLGR